MNIEYSVILALVAMLFWGVGDFFIQRNVRKIGNLESLAYIGIIGSIMLFPFVYNELGLLLTIENLALLSLLGVLVFISALFNFEALKKGKLSVIDVILELELPIVVLLSFIFLKETLTLIQALIIGLLFIGIVFVAVERFSFKGLFKKLEKGAIIAVIGAVGLGLIDFLTATSSRTISPVLAVWMPWLMVSIISLVFIFKRERVKVFVEHGIRLKYWILIMGVLDILAWLAYAHAMEISNVAVITAITEAYPAVALFLGVWMNKERIKKHQYIGAGIALGASFLLAFVI